MKQSKFLALVVLSVLTLSACLSSPGPGSGPSRHHQMTDLNGLVFQLSYGGWNWYAATNAHQGRAWYPYMNWSTDGCSHVGSGPYDFYWACTRHDFSYRNLQRISNHFPQQSSVWNGGNKNAADDRFKDDLYARCGQIHWTLRPGCWPLAETYWGSVNAIPPYGSRTGSFGW